MLTASLSAGCGGGGATAANPEVTSETKSVTGAGAPTFAAQVESGQALYGRHCAKCDGSGGEGASAPAVVGIKSSALPLEPRAGAIGRTSSSQISMLVLS